MATLYIVSTPIGNLKDITLRAIEILSRVGFIACEDTRKTGNLLNKIETFQPGDTIISQRRDASRAKLISYYEENELRRIPQIIKLLKEGEDVALVSSAGTPTISDPGFKLVRECTRQGIKTEIVPGPSAVLAALVASGLPTDKFLFLGFLPKKQGKRIRLLKDLALMIPIIRVTTIIFISPHRFIKELKDVRKVFGEIEIVLCRELTKIHEEIRREKISWAINHFENTKPRGEFVLLFQMRTL